MQINVNNDKGPSTPALDNAAFYTQSVLDHIQLKCFSHRHFMTVEQTAFWPVLYIRALLTHAQQKHVKQMVVCRTGILLIFTLKRRGMDIASEAGSRRLLELA